MAKVNNFRTSLTQTIWTIAVFCCSLIFMVVVAYAVKAFSPPTANPPGNNTDAPVTKDSNGNVGIGISPPLSRLHIRDGQTWGSDLRVDAQGVAGGRAYSFISTGGDASEGQGKLLFKDNNDNAVRMTIDSSGNVGIGTESPLGKLHVEGTSVSGGEDQKQNLYSNSVVADDGWQSFTPSINGALVAFKFGHMAGADVTLSIYSGEGIGGSLLHSQTIFLSSSAVGEEHTLSSPIFLNAGTLYTFRIQQITTPITFRYYNWGGYGYGRSNIGIDQDFAFTTYMATLNEKFLAVGTDGNIGIGGENFSNEKLKISGGNIVHEHASTSPPIVRGSTSIADSPRDIHVRGKFAYVVSADENTLSIVDIHNPDDLNIVGSVVDAVQLKEASRIFVAGKYAYITGEYDGGCPCAQTYLAVVDISNSNSPQIVGYLSDPIVLDLTTDIYVSGRYAYITTQYAQRLVAIDISDPTSPYIVDDYSVSGQVMGIDVQGRYAYITTSISGGTLHVIDISDPSSLAFVGSANHAELSGVGGIDVSGSYAYLVSQNNDKIVVFDISNSSTPTFAGSTPASSQYLNSPSEIKIAGQYAYVTADDYRRGVLTVVDISNPAFPKIISAMRDWKISRANRALYIAGKYAYLGSSLDDRFVIADISGINSPSASIGILNSTEISVDQNASIANNLYVGNGVNVGSGGIYSDGDICAGGECLGGSGGSCPSGFTSISSAGNTLGCMQNDEEGSGTWIMALDDCFDTYGGRLPHHGEFYIAILNYTLQNESEDYEWMNDRAYSDYSIVTTGTATLNVDKDTSGYAYRCFIPN